MTRKEVAFYVLKIVMFAPFFFGMICCLFQTIQVIRFLSVNNHYEATSFIKQGEYSSGGRSPSRFVFGTLKEKKEEVTVLADWISQVKKSQVADTIYIWYIKDKIGIPRPYDEKEFKVWSYAYSDYWLLKILGIPPFLILLIIDRIMRRKKRKLVQKTKFGKR